MKIRTSKAAEINTTNLLTQRPKRKNRYFKRENKILKRPKGSVQRQKNARNSEEIKTCLQACGKVCNFLFKQITNLVLVSASRRRLKES